MNKKRINAYLPNAIQALTEVGIVQDGKIVENYNALISTFGAVLSQGDLKSAVAFLAKDKGPNTESRINLLRAIYYVISGELEKSNRIFTIICESSDLRAMKEQCVDGAIALKQAMKLYDMGKGGKRGE